MDGLHNVEAADNDAGIGKGGKYLTFLLGSEEYGLSLARVREIIALMVITPMPLTPEYVRGVMNLRGKVIPVVDLRRKFGMEPTKDHDRKCIIVVDVEREAGPIRMSILVDEVSEVVHIASQDIEDPPSLSAGVDTSFIHGIAKAKNRVKILLEIDAVLSSVGNITVSSAAVPTAESPSVH